MRINETTLRRYIRTLLEETGLETTPAEAAAQAALVPKTNTQSQQGTPDNGQPTSETDMPPADVDALARKMREKGASETSVKDMLSAAMGNR